MTLPPAGPRRPIAVAALLGTLLAAALLAAPAASALDDEVVASGHIAAGAPHTLFLSLAESDVEGVDGFSFDAAPVAGGRIATETTDHTGLGHDVDVYFYQADGTYIDHDGCATASFDEECDVPSTAATGYVVAFFGADLTVDVLAV